MNSSENHFVHSFVKKPGEKIQVALRKFKGKFYVDLRLWFQQEPDKNFLPSRKGISFELEHLPEFRSGIEQLAKAAADLKNRSSQAPSGHWKQAERFNKPLQRPVK